MIFRGERGLRLTATDAFVVLSNDAKLVQGLWAGGHGVKLKRLPNTAVWTHRRPEARRTDTRRHDGVPGTRAPLIPGLVTC